MLTAVVLALSLATSAPALAAADTTPAQAPPVPLLWKVSDADNSLYLLGSFHLLRADDYPLSADVDAAFDDAEALLFELDPRELESPALGAKMARAALRTDGRTLEQALPPALAEQLEAWFAASAPVLSRSGLSADALQRFEPWFAGLTISMLDMSAAGLDPALGLDRHLGDAAIAAGKAVAGLETGEQQIAFLDGMAATEQLQLLEEALSNSQDGDAELEALHAQWRAGDAKALWNGMAAEMRERYPGMYAHVNVARNDAWLPSLEARLQAPGTDDTLVVVGALHLLGSDGVVEKLRARGYDVERICSACGD